MYLSSLVLIADYGRKWYHFCFNDICEPKGIIEEIIFVSNITDHRRRMVKSIYVIKHTFIKVILFWDVYSKIMFGKVAENKLL